MKAMTVIILFAVLLISNSVHSATFARRLSNVGALQQTIRTSDGGYVLLINDGEKNKIVLRKIDPNGKKIWHRQLRSHQDLFEADAIAIAIDAGIFLSIHSIPGGNGMLKLDSKGTIEWNKGFVGLQLDFELRVKKFHSVVGTMDGGALAAGSGCVLDWCGNLALVKFSKTGVIEWSKSLTSDIYLNAQRRVHLSQTSDGRFIVDVSTGGSGTALLRLNSLGEVEWSRLLKTDDLNEIEIQPTEDGGMILASLGASIDSETKLLLAKLDSSGKVLWKKGAAFKNFSIASVQLAENLSSDSSYVLFGSVSSEDHGIESFLARVNATGKIQSVTVFGGNTLGGLRYAYPNADGRTVLFGAIDNAETVGGVFYAGLDQGDKLRSCSFLSSIAKPVKSTFGSLKIDELALTNEGPLKLTPSDLLIQSKRLKKNSTNFCP